jgi:hypothetical protein
MALGCLFAACDSASPLGEFSGIPETVTSIAPETGSAPGVRPPVEPDRRSTRRVTVDQLRRSIPLLFGGETWTTTFQRREVDLFDGLSRTLGEADYVEVTTANTDPGPLFQKFMDDMAANLCTKATERDVSSAPSEEKLVIAYPDDVDQNLRFLRFKFHGIHTPSDTPTEADGLQDLRDLYADLDAEHGSQTAWVGVCMAIVTAPEFLAY